MRKLKGRQLLTLLLLVLLCCMNLFVITANADDGARVSRIRINVTNDNGKVKFASAEEEKYTVTYPTEKINVSVGEMHVDFEVTVQAEDGYYFEDIDEKDIYFKKDSSGVKCTDVSYDTEEAKIDIEIAIIKGKLEEPDSAWWDEDDFGMACWDKVEEDGVTGYTISINGQEITVLGTTRKDLRSYLNWGKNNYFKVKAISTKSGVKDSSYVRSDILDLTEDGDYWDDYYYDNYNYGVTPGLNNHNNYGWIFNEGKWYFINQNGQKQRSWLDLNDGRYYFEQNGEMVTGWKMISGYWYYFSSDGRMKKNTVIKSANGHFDYFLGSNGRMLNNRWQQNQYGWYYIGQDEPVKNCEKNINSKTYRFNSNGYMITGWWFDGVDGWYYYYPDGSKAKDTFIWSDGRYYELDRNGKWTW